MSAVNQSLRLLALSPSINGANPLFVFLPGMDGRGHLFQPQIEGLTAHFDVRAVSIPTNDLTDWPGLVEQTAALIRLEQQAAALRPIYICGESFGGCLALKLAIHFPNLCSRLILINPASSFGRQPWLHWATSAIKRIPASLYRLSASGLLPFLIAQSRVSDSNRLALLQAMQSVTPEAAAWRIRLLSRFVLEELPLAQLTQPALVIASAADRLLPSVSEGDRLTRYLPNARQVILPESGHACLLETEVKLSKILRSQEFLSYAPIG
jgi:pimeloyl-ACP methyl ester carboxylesterase